MTTGKILKKYSDSKNVSDIILLLSHVIKKPKEYILAHSEYRLSCILYLKFYFLWRRYRRGWSVAAIVGHKEFYGLNFLVNRHTLIPRPETELLVDEALRALTTDYSPQTTATSGAVDRSLSSVVLVDVGTGSGCIPIATAASIRKSGLSGYPDKIIAIDISRPALRIAKKNAAYHNIKIKFLHGNLLSPIIGPDSLFIIPDSSLVITANLPYLTAEQFAAEPSIQKEPRSALVAPKSNNGLALYEQLLGQIKLLLEIRNLALPKHDPARAGKLEIFFEIDPSQSSRIVSLIKKYLPTATIEIKTDLAGRDRLVVICVDR